LFEQDLLDLRTITDYTMYRSNLSGPAANAQPPPASGRFPQGAQAGALGQVWLNDISQSTTCWVGYDRWAQIDVCEVAWGTTERGEGWYCSLLRDELWEPCQLAWGQ
jgi:hypothetical protein